MDTGSNLDSLQQQASAAANNVADMQSSAPGMLNQLKQNLVGIFAKDNPIMGARNDALSNYLSTAANTRADLLPANTGDVPGIAGRPLTYSPTQQDAIVQSRQSAALAPLAGYNEILKGMYGTLGDVVNNAGNIYNSTIQSNATRAGNLMDLYKQAVQQDQFNKNLELQKEQLARQYASMFPYNGMDLLSALMGGGQGGGIPDLSAYETPLKAGGKTNTASPKPQPKVSLQGASSKANINPNMSFGGNQLAGSNPTPANNGGNWLIQPILDWAKGLANPLGNNQPQYANLSAMGF